MRKENFMSKKKIILAKGLVRKEGTEEYSKMKLCLPVPKDKITEFGSRKISPAHVGNLNNSIDFMVPENTEIYAAADGTVVEVRDDSKIGGDDPKYWNDGNYIAIKHGEELTWYEHLKHRGVLVKVGNEVKEGQLIGYSGNTGFTKEPHLHFHVYKIVGKTSEDYVTLKAVFKDFPDIYQNE